MNKLQWGSQKKTGSILQNKKAKMNSQQELYILQCRSLGAQTRNVQREVFLELEGIWWLWPLGWINEVQKQSLVSLGGEALKTKTRTKQREVLSLFSPFSEVSSLLCHIPSCLDIFFNRMLTRDQANNDKKSLKQWAKTQLFVHLILLFKAFSHSYTKLTNSLVIIFRNKASCLT